ncbi:hypothetical protein JCM1840_000513 [Sporobolomyces johnsonii]
MRADWRLQGIALSFVHTLVSAGSQSHLAPTDCIDSITVPEINSLLRTGGEGTAIVLCPYTQVSVDPHGPPITFTAARQSLYTVGFPEDHSRAGIVIESDKAYHGDLTTAIKADCDACRGVNIRNLRVDGGRELLGGVEGGDALILVGGAQGEQEVRSVDAFGARGYAILHASAGRQGTCSGVTIAENTFHTSGDAPVDAFLNSELVRLRDGSPAHRGHERPGKWTDGISVACAQSTVLENTIRDVSGVGIAIRGAPGSQVHQNTIVAHDRDMLVGISLVANPIFNKRAGQAGGIVVRENRIHAATAMIRVGISTGDGAWSTDELAGDHQIPFGSEIVKNRISSHASYYAYAIALSDARGIVVEDNAVSASIWGFETPACYDRPHFVTPTPLLRDPRSVIGRLQPEFVNQHFGFLLCVGPGSASSSFEMSRHQINVPRGADHDASSRDAASAGRPSAKKGGRSEAIPKREMHPVGARGSGERKHGFRGVMVAHTRAGREKVQPQHRRVNDVFDVGGSQEESNRKAVVRQGEALKTGMQQRRLRAPRAVGRSAQAGLHYFS